MSPHLDTIHNHSSVVNPLHQMNSQEGSWMKAFSIAYCLLNSSLKRLSSSYMCMPKTKMSDIDSVVVSQKIILRMGEGALSRYEDICLEVVFYLRKERYSLAYLPLIFSSHQHTQTLTHPRTCPRNPLLFMLTLRKCSYYENNNFIYIKVSKVGDCSRGRLEGSLFNSYYTKV